MINIAEANELLGHELELVVDGEVVTCVVVFLFPDDCGRVYAGVVPIDDLDEENENEAGRLIVMEVDKEEDKLVIIEASEEDWPNIVDHLARRMKKTWSNAETLVVEGLGEIDLTKYTPH